MINVSIPSRPLRLSIAIVLSPLLFACSVPGSEPTPIATAPANPANTAQAASSSTRYPDMPNKPRPAPALPPVGAVLEDGEVIRLERSGCGFRCPAYQLSLYRDGRVHFNGRAHTAVIGAAESRISPDAVAALLAELQQQLPALAGRYLPGTKDCGPMFTDQPTMKLAAQLQQGLVRSERYGGCPGAPKSLAVLEKRVDAVGGSARWISAAPMS